MTVKAAIVAIGSELLAGQITNRNAAWLSSRLLDLGIRVVEHVVVDDIETDIVAALTAVARQAELLLVTGGLGPTSDDRTRQAVASFVARPLAFDASSWQHIQSFFARLQLPVPESNRQQCFFPEGARVLVNQAGTANAFALEHGATRLFVLPGPPREVEVIWNDYLAPALAGVIPVAERPTTRKWRTIGRGESHIAEVVEPLVAGCGAEIAYRAHAPFIETKLSFRAADAGRLAAVVQTLDQALAPWLYETDDEDVVAALATRLAVFRSLNLYDGATQGHLIELLAPRLREQTNAPAALSLATSWEAHDSPALFVRNCLHVNDDVELALAVAGFDDSGGWALGVRSKSLLVVQEKPSPLPGVALRSRNLRAVGALTARAFYDILTATTTH